MIKIGQTYFQDLMVFAPRLFCHLHEGVNNTKYERVFYIENKNVLISNENIHFYHTQNCSYKPFLKWR